MSQAYARFTRTAAGRYEVRLNYDPVAVATIKESVPAHARSWDSSRKVWTIDRAFARPLARALAELHVQSLGLDEESLPRPESTGSWASAMFAALPERLHDSVFRALSRVLHPDIGGDTRAAQQLNDARPGKRSAS